MKSIYLIFGVIFSLQSLHSSNIQLTLNTKSHYGLINKIIVSPDKKLIVSLSDDKVIKIYDADNFELKQELYGEINYEKNGIANTAIFTNDSKYLIVAGYFFKNNDNYLRVYNVDTKKIENVLKVDTSVITDICLSNDNKYILVGSENGDINIFDFQNRKKLNSIKLHKSSITSIKFLTNKDKYSFVSSSIENTVSIYSIDEEQLKYRVTVPNSTTPNGIAINNNDIAVITDMYLFLYDYNLNLIDEIPFQPFLAVNSISFSDDGSLLLTGGSSKNNKSIELLKNGGEKYLTKNMLKVYDAKKNYETILSFDQSMESNVNTATFLTNDKIISATSDFSLYLNDFNSKKSLRKTTPINIPEEINFLNNNLYLTFKASKNDFKFDVNNLKLSSTEKMNINTNNPKENGILELSKDVFNGTYFIKSDGYTIYLIDKTTKLYKSSISNKYMITDYLWYEDYIITADMHGDIKIYTMDNNNIKEIVTLHGDGFIINSLTIGENYLYSLGAEGIVKIWDLKNIIKHKDTKAIASMFIDSYDDFIIWTEEGYFTVSSPKALKYITWHMNQGYDKEAIRYDIGKFYDVFFRPDLVKLKIQGKDITPYTNGLTVKDVLQNPPPEVKITKVDEKNIIHKNDLTYTAQVDTKNDNVQIKFNVADYGGGIGNIRVYQEGKLIQTIGDSKINKVIANIDTKIEEEKKEEKLKEYQQLALSKAISGENLKLDEQIASSLEKNLATNKSGEYSIDIPLKKGINQISIEAFNKTNTITSFRSTVNINADIPYKKPKLYAIVAGVNNFESSYGNSLQNLQYAVNDAKAIKDIASKTKGGLFDDVEIIHLENNEVTKENLVKAFDKIKQYASLEDTIVFYISTHGISVNGKFYLIPSNNAQVSNLIEFNEIFKESSDTKSLNQIFIIDTCQSGSANDIASSVYDSRASVLARSSGIHLLSASTSGTKAFENDEYQHSNFTYKIIQAVNNIQTDINQDGFTSVIEISNVLKKQEPESKQLPVIQNIGNDIKLNKVN